MESVLGAQLKGPVEIPRERHKGLGRVSTPQGISQSINALVGSREGKRGPGPQKTLIPTGSTIHSPICGQ